MNCQSFLFSVVVGLAPPLPLLFNLIPMLKGWDVKTGSMFIKIIKTPSILMVKAPSLGNGAENLK